MSTANRCTDHIDASHYDMLEYVFGVADKFAPDIVLDGHEAYKVDSQAPFLFMHRYNSGMLHLPLSYSDYINGSRDNNDNAIDIIRALGIDPDKFWYLFVFVVDYVLGSTRGALQCNPTPKEEILKLIDFIEQNEESVSRFYGVVPKQEIKLTLHTKGRKLVIENPNTLFVLSRMCRMALPDIEDGDLINTSKASLADKSDSVRIWLFARMMRYFFTLYPQFTSKRARGNTTTKSTLRLISKLVYMAGLTANEDYDVDDENLKSLLKQYRNYKLDTINSIYR